jgi:hypothetical protein
MSIFSRQGSAGQNLSMQERLEQVKAEIQQQYACVALSLAFAFPTSAQTRQCPRAYECTFDLLSSVKYADGRLEPEREMLQGKPPRHAPGRH